MYTMHLLDTFPIIYQLSEVLTGSVINNVSALKYLYKDWNIYLQHLEMWRPGDLWVKLTVDGTIRQYHKSSYTVPFESQSDLHYMDDP